MNKGDKILKKLFCCIDEGFLNLVSTTELIVSIGLRQEF